MGRSMEWTPDVFTIYHGGKGVRYSNYRDNNSSRDFGVKFSPV